MPSTHATAGYEKELCMLYALLDLESLIVEDYIRQGQGRSVPAQALGATGLSI